MGTKKEGMVGLGGISSGMQLLPGSTQSMQQQLLQPSPRKKPRKQLLPPTHSSQDTAANPWMFENENQSQMARSTYGSNVRRKVPIMSRSGITSRVNQQHDMHELQHNTDIQQEEENNAPTSNYISDK